MKITKYKYNRKIVSAFSVELNHAGIIRILLACCIKSTFDDQLRFRMTVFLLFPAFNLARVLCSMVLLNALHNQPAVADNVFFDLKVGVVFRDFRVVLLVHQLTPFRSVSVVFKRRCPI